MGVSVKFTHKGDFNKVEGWFKSLLNRNYLKMLNTYGEMGVSALRSATPVDTGLAASSWGYEVNTDGNIATVTWTNSDIEGGCSVVILIDKGHATKSGTWVTGQHFIDPALEPVIERLTDAVWKEATRV